MQVSNSGLLISAPKMNLDEAYALFGIYKESERAWADLSALRSQILNTPPSEVAKLEKAYDMIQTDQTQNYGWVTTAGIREKRLPERRPRNALVVANPSNGVLTP